jgi:hypothetical protein
MNRWIVLAALCAVLVVPGCSKTTHTTPPASSTTTTSSATSSTDTSTSTTDTSSSETGVASAPLDPQACVDITQANLDLATASDEGAARTAGDLFEKYNPPSQVKDAIEHFVGTKGAQLTDPDYDKYNNTIESWVKQVCPV